MGVDELVEAAEADDEPGAVAPGHDRVSGAAVRRLRVVLRDP